jgi:hypothetical protein
MDESGNFLKDEIQKFKSRLSNKEVKKEAERVFPVCFEKGMYILQCIMLFGVQILTHD